MTEEKKETMIVDQLKPGAEFSAIELPDEFLEETHAISLMADLAKKEGTEQIFGITAGAEFPMEGLFMKAGIKRVHVRHEQTATFAADAVGRMNRRTAVTVIGPSTGLCNATSGIAQSNASQSPTLVIGGEHPAWTDSVQFAQGLVRGEQMFQGITKDLRRVTNPISLLYEFKRLYRLAMTPPMGPTALLIPWDTSYEMCRMPLYEAYSLYGPGNFERTEQKMRYEDPALIEEAMKWLLAGENPGIIAGESLWYDDAQEELRELVALTGIPCHTRRMARGAIDEYDPLNCYGRARGRFLRKCDRALILGLRIGYLEMHGYPPFWGQQTRYAQAQTCRENVDLYLGTDYELIGNIKALVKQMIECVKDMGITSPPEKWDEWRKYIADSKKYYEEKTIERTEKMRGVTPVHPDLVGRLIYEVVRDELDDEVISIIDGFTASSFYTDWNRCRTSGRVLDASDTIGIGHGPGLALGAGLATDRKIPMVCLIGDGGLGAGGMDIETCARWDIPVVFIHENNNTMVAGGWKLFWSKACSPTGNEMLDSWSTLPNIRYDKIMAEFGCHTEFVEKDGEMKSALKRSLDFVRDKSKPAFIEVFVEGQTMNEIWATFLTNCCGFLEWEDLPEEGRDAIMKLGLCDPTYRSFAPTWPDEAFAVRKKR
ncbi:MAG: thiamine pyrophosphate-binding protein [Desulfobacterales bacterium]|jgi:thiamine pyrophosphate-dependent acetolactate synthase large subunit-like protein